ncbi:MAG: hypothetical protein EPN84_09500 [Legionella sp.]|nr:MAG: hypothetical protein EPN84_09500 [Legionella sp.]
MMELNAIRDSFLWEIFVGHHYALLGLFYSEVKVESNSLSVGSNVENDTNWQYFGYTSPYHDELIKNQNIYTNQEIDFKNYNLVYTDVWLANELIAVNSKINAPGLEVLQVKDAQGMELFADVFLEAYSLQTDPYGNLNPSYKSCMIKSFLSKSSKVKFYYVLHQGTPCATFALSFIANYCYSYCLGVIPKYRGQGISHFIHQYRNHEAAKNKCKFNILQTISTSYVEGIAKNNGFAPIGTFSLFASTASA